MGGQTGNTVLFMTAALPVNFAAKIQADPLHAQLAAAVRLLAADAVEAAQSGHPGMPLGMADVATVLFREFLKFDASHPDWADRDRFILSAGHGSMLLYALLYLTGYEEVTLEDIKKFRQLGSFCAGHPEHHISAGIETTTGPLGQGLGNAVGMAIAEAHLAARFGNDLVNHYTYVIASDGDLMEGISHESCALAGHLGLNKLIVLYDDNGISIDGPTSLSYTENAAQRFEAYGWAIQQIDGHDPAAIRGAIAAAQNSNKPSLICCKTTIGLGSPNKAGSASSHGAPLGAEDIQGVRDFYQWPHAPFEIPVDVLAAWRAIGIRGASLRKAWQGRHDFAAQRAEFDNALNGNIPAEALAVLAQYKNDIIANKPSQATRVSSGQVIDALMPHIPELIGGSADLSGSNNTKSKSATILSKTNYAGRYIHYGVREHGMCSAMNGMALHGGVIPFGGTFLVFADYCRPAIRLAALMKQRVIFVMTHDSIGVGEDGPTHQPIEQLSSLRCIPGLQVFRPCDPVEVAEAWELALQHHDGPSVLVLTRQNLPTVRTELENKSAQGAYILRDAPDAQICLIATGSEVSLALETADKLAAHDILARVVSMPCMELFARQPTQTQAQILGGKEMMRVAIEAAHPQSWHRWVGEYGLICGIDSFGASGKYQDLYRHFGLTADAISAKISALL